MRGKFDWRPERLVKNTEDDARKILSNVIADAIEQNKCGAAAVIDRIKEGVPGIKWEGK